MARLRAQAGVASQLIWLILHGEGVYAQDSVVTTAAIVVEGAHGSELRRRRLRTAPKRRGSTAQSSWNSCWRN